MPGHPVDSILRGRAQKICEQFVSDWFPASGGAASPDNTSESTGPGLFSGLFLGSF
jgi:hypothetical protein